MMHYEKAWELLEEKFGFNIIRPGLLNNVVKNKKNKNISPE
jgi:hypothetical protein